MKLFLVATFALGVVACSSSDDAPAVGSGHGNCASREGSTYLVHFTEHAGGTCGAVTDAVLQGHDLSTSAAGCTGPTKASADGCTVSIDQTCPSDAVSKGGSFKETGQAKWSVDASRATGIETVQIFDATGAALCGSTYDITYARQ